MFDKTTILQIKAAGGDLHFHFIQFAEKPHQTSCHLHHSAPPNHRKLTTIKPALANTLLFKTLKNSEVILDSQRVSILLDPKMQCLIL